MKVTDSRLKQLDNPSLTANERILLRCRLAAEFIHTGQYETARDALGHLWQGIGEHPQVETLKPPTAAEVILQCGALSSWFGKAQHISGAQERAKDLLSEALRLFKSHGEDAKAAAAQYELGMCYFWLGAYDEARVVLDEALKGLQEKDAELKAKILIRRTVVEIWTGRYHDALKILEEAETLRRCAQGQMARAEGSRLRQTGERRKKPRLFRPRNHRIHRRHSSLRTGTA